MNVRDAQRKLCDESTTALRPVFDWWWTHTISFPKNVLRTHAGWQCPLVFVLWPSRRMRAHILWVTSCASSLSPGQVFVILCLCETWPGQEKDTRSGEVGVDGSLIELAAHFLFFYILFSSDWSADNKEEIIWPIL